MPNQRRIKRLTYKFDCPLCRQRLWHLGSPRYYLHNSWLEEFFCEKHDKMWMRLSRDVNEQIVAVRASRDDWTDIVETEC